MVSAGRLIRRKQKVKAVKAASKQQRRANRQSSASDDSSDSSDDNSETNEDQTEQQQPEELLKKEWRNRTRALVFCSRGCSYKHRHLMQDLRDMMPHAKSESKMDKKDRLPLINEIAAMKNCAKCVYFENRKRKDLYMWLAHIGTGPSVKFLVHNVHTMAELKMTGNCLKGSRPILSFDKAFDASPHLRLTRELITQTFCTPNQHPKSQPFFDHVFTFAVSDDGKIWFRNYQIVNDGASLEEIGPRMVLEPIKVFEGSFGGAVLYENPQFHSPNVLRRNAKLAAQAKYAVKVAARNAARQRDAKLKNVPSTDPLEEELFQTDAPPVDQAATLKRKLEKRARHKKKKSKKPKLAAAVET